MRYVILTLVLFSTLGVCFAQLKRSQFSVQGKFEGSHTKMVTFFYNDPDSGNITKKCNIINNHFSFSGYISEPVIVYVKGIIADDAVDDDNNGEFFIEPGLIKIFLQEDHFKSMVISGSNTENQHKALETSKASIYKLQRPCDSLLSEYNRILIKIPEKDTVQSKLITAKRLSVIAESRKYSSKAMMIDRQFISLHKDSYLSPYLLYLQFHAQKLNLDSTMRYFDKFSPEIKKSFWGKELSRRFVLLKIGEKFPNITGFNINSRNVNLEDLFKTNYTLIVIWASWCVPCRANMPNLMKLYDKYRNKGFSIIALTEDNSKKDWLTAIRKDKLLAWEHLLPDQHASLVKTLGLYGIPAEILLNKGIIIEKYSGANPQNTETETIEKKLDQIFAN